MLPTAAPMWLLSANLGQQTVRESGYTAHTSLAKGLPGQAPMRGDGRGVREGE